MTASDNVDKGPADANSRLATARASVESLKMKLSEVNDEITERSAGKEEYLKKRNELRKSIDELNELWLRARDELRAMNERDNQNVAAATAPEASVGKAQKGRFDKLQATLGYKSVAAIDERLRDIEYIIMTSQMSNKEAKLLKAEAEKLTKIRPDVMEMEELENRLHAAALESQESKITTTANNNSSSSDRRIELRNQIRDVRRYRDELVSEQESLYRQRMTILGPLYELHELRDSLKSEIAKLQNEINQIMEEQRQKEMQQKAEQAKKRQSQLELERFDRQIKVIEKEKNYLRAAITSATVPPHDWTHTKAMELKEYLQDSISRIEQVNKGRDATTPDTKAHSNKSTDTSSPEKIQLNNQTYVVHRKQEETCAVRPKKNKNVRHISNHLNHPLAGLKDFEALGVTIPTVIDEASQTFEELDQILERQKKVLEEKELEQRKKQAELEKQLEQLLIKEKELLAKAPAGYKQTAAV